MSIDWIVAPLLGGVIGCVTNYIAIKMLFRPARPWRIGRFRVPFTPGLIPKEKLRIAQSIGQIVGTELLGEASVARALLSDAAIDRLIDGLDGLIERGRQSEQTLYGGLSSLLGAENAQTALARGEAYLAAYLAERLKNADLGESAARSFAGSIREKTPGALAEFLGRVGGDRLGRAITEQIRVSVNGYVARHADELVQNALSAELDQLKNTRLAEFVQANEERLPGIREKIRSLYRQAVERSLGKALRALDIPAIVRSHIEAIDDRALEQMILNVADRELKAIVALGALLGALMGFVNLLV